MHATVAGTFAAVATAATVGAVTMGGAVVPKIFELGVGKPEQSVETRGKLGVGVGRVLHLLDALLHLRRRGLELHHRGQHGHGKEGQVGAHVGGAGAGGTGAGGGGGGRRGKLLLPASARENVLGGSGQARLEVGTRVFSGRHPGGGHRGGGTALRLVPQGEGELVHRPNRRTHRRFGKRGG